MKNILRLSAFAVVAASFAGCAATNAPTANAGLLNAKCPMMPNCGKPLSVTTQYNQGTVGFCCGGCKAEWAKLDDATRAAKFAAVKK